jgi:hypothetical protein
LFIFPHPEGAWACEHIWETKETHWSMEHNENFTSIFETSVRPEQGSAVGQESCDNQLGKAKKSKTVVSALIVT